MEEEEHFDKALNEVDEVVLTTNVSQLVHEYQGELILVE